MRRNVNPFDILGLRSVILVDKLFDIELRYCHLWDNQAQRWKGARYGLETKERF
jgi:hypothetical protein